MERRRVIAAVFQSSILMSVLWLSRSLVTWDSAVDTRTQYFGNKNRAYIVTVCNYIVGLPAGPDTNILYILTQTRTYFCGQR